jgi:hypothetical protein
MDKVLFVSPVKTEIQYGDSSSATPSSSSSILANVQIVNKFVVKNGVSPH